MIKDEIRSITASLPAGVRLVAVSKYHPEAAIQEAYEAGQRIFGESHVQELQRKHDSLPKDIEWHFIGHLQTNKVKYLAPYVSLIHAVDTPHLLAEISKQGQKCGRRIPCLLQLHVAAEETKFGFTPDEAEAFLREGAWRDMAGAELRGVMCMATNTDDQRQIAGEFEQAHQFFLHARDTYFNGGEWRAQDGTLCHFGECSWGMSDDYPIALQHGSTMVRIGSRIFGQRQY